MAPKRPTHDLPPPSESESEDSSSTDADSDSQPQQLTQSQPQQTHQDSDSDSDSDDTSENTHNPSSVVSQLKANGKRPADTDQISKSKKSKGVEKIGDKKSVPFARLFTEKDEIVLLQGMIEYKEKNGSDPTLDSFAFHESIKDFLSCSATKYQTADKIRRLKKKFMNNVKRGQNGQDPVISRPHEYKSFDLSKKIWASEVHGGQVDGDVKASNSTRNKNNKGDDGGSKTPLKSVGNRESDIHEQVMVRNEVETEDIWSLYPSLCASLESEAIKNLTGPVTPKGFVKKVVNRLEKEKARALEQEWEGFLVMEQQVYAKRVKLISEQAEVAMNVLKP